jgi:hypothetical protein
MIPRVTKLQDKLPLQYYLAWLAARSFGLLKLKMIILRLRVQTRVALKASYHIMGLYSNKI